MRTPSLLIILVLLVAACGGAPAASVPPASGGAASMPASTAAAPSTEPTEAATPEPTAAPEPTALGITAAIAAVNATLAGDWPEVREGFPSGFVGYCALTVDLTMEPDWTETQRIAASFSSEHPVSTGEGNGGDLVRLFVEVHTVYPDDVMTQLGGGLDTCGPFDEGPTLGAGSGAASAATMAGVDGVSWSSSYVQTDPNYPRCIIAMTLRPYNCQFEDRGFYAMVRDLLIGVTIRETAAAETVPDDPDAILADVVNKVVAALEDA